MTVVTLRGVDSAPEADSRFPTRSTTTLYLAVRWLEIHIMEPILPARAFFEAARCAGHLQQHTDFEERTTVSVV